MEKDIKGAIERLTRANNDIWYATLYSQEEQDKDIEILLKEYRQLQQIEKEHQKENGELRKKVKELEEAISKEHTLGYSQGIYDCSEAWKETIRKKREKYNKQRIKMEKDDIGVGFTLGKEWSDLKAKITVLQDLLEENK